MATSVRPNGMSSSAAALRYWERRQEISSNNLANVSTEGFKGQKAFARMVENGLPTADATTDFTPGTAHATGNPMDVSIEGQGFFVVNTPNGERLSRGGTMHVNDDGKLVDSSGNAMLGEHGEIQVTGRGNRSIGTIDIGQDGAVHIDGAEVDRLRVETVAPTDSLAKEGTGLFVPPAARTRLAADANVVRQGSLEESNVSSVGEMVDMIAIQRAYTAVQKAMSTLDAVRGIATTELGKPAN